MTRVFADSFYFLALLNKKDVKHSAAMRWTRTQASPIVTSEWVLLELADALASTKNRSAFAQTRQELFNHPKCRVVPLDMTLYEEGIHLFINRPDKEWSLTDCISFVIMQREGIADALTGDHHFEQACFAILLK